MTITKVELASAARSLRLGFLLLSLALLPAGIFPARAAEALAAGRATADGVMVYCHQNPKSQPAKYAVIRRTCALAP